MTPFASFEPTCARVRKSFSAYLDGAVTGREMQGIAAHLESCEPCAAAFSATRAIQEALVCSRAKAPDDLGLRLRLAISREQAAKRSSWSDAFSLAWTNTLRPMALQTAAGLACAITLIGTIVVLLGVVTPPNAVLANDEPLAAVTPPHYLYSIVRPRPILLEAHPLATMVVEADIDSTGRVYDFVLVSAPSGPDADAIRAQIADQLLLSVFKPATVFGVPVKGRLTLTFAGVPVRS